MTISVNDSCTTNIALDYAKLCDLSYAEWKFNQGNNTWELKTEKYSALWTEMLGNKYIVKDFISDTQTGFSATIFYNNETKKTVIAIRGVEYYGLSSDFYAAMTIADGNAPTEQFRSMVNFMIATKTRYLRIRL